MRATYKFLALVIVVLFVGIFGCSDDSSSNGLSTYSDDIKDCAPDLSSSASALWINATGSDGWSPTAEYGVLKKLFHPDSGTESIYGPIESMDRIIDFINEFSQNFDENGTFTAESENTELTATNEDLTGGVTSIPYLGGAETNAIKLLNVTGSGDSSLTLKAAYGIDELKEYLVFRSKHEYTEDGVTQIEYTVCHASRDDETGDISIELASICDKNGDGSIETNPNVADDFLIRYKFVGNTLTKVFKLTQKTNAGSGWGVMAGGSVASSTDKVAVRATQNADSTSGANDYTNITADATDVLGYYVVLTMDQINNPTSLDSSLDGDRRTVDGSWPKPASSFSTETEEFKKYLIIGETDNLGWVNEYPAVITDLNWD